MANHHIRNTALSLKAKGLGRTVRTYNAERTLCDMIRSRNQMDSTLLPDALKRYVRRKDRNISLLMKYLEVLL